MRQEKKVELTARIATRDTAGHDRTVEEYTTFVRVLLLSGEWTNWARGSRSYRCGTEHVNARKDGNFELVMTGELLTRL